MRSSGNTVSRVAARAVRDECRSLARRREEGVRRQRRWAVYSPSGERRVVGALGSAVDEVRGNRGSGRWRKGTGLP